MSIDVVKGKVYVVGDDVNTDLILPARYMNTMDPKILGEHAMEDLDPKQYSTPFMNEDKSCDYKIIVAGRNFGCGSSREHAPIALHAAGVKAVITQSFARIFYRNCVNGGLILPLESVEDLSSKIKTGDMVELRLSDNILEHNGVKHQLKPFGPVKEIIDAGGLTVYNKKRLGL